MRGDRIHLVSRYHPDVVDLSKQISGARWSKTAGAWTFPLTMAALRHLRRSFGRGMKLDPSLRRWAAREIKRERELRKLQRDNDATLVLTQKHFPETAEAMSSRKYQRAGAMFAKVSGGRFLLADEPGLGKTLQVIAGITELGAIEGTHLIFCTKSAANSVWASQIRRWAPGSQVMVLPDGAAARRKAISEFLTLEEPRFLVAGYASIRRMYGHFCSICDIWEEDHVKSSDAVPKEHWLQDHGYKRAIRKDALPELMAIPWDAVVADESHKALSAYTPGNISQQTQAILDLESKYRIALTGTPLRGSETKLWGTLDWLGYKTGGYWGWINNYFETAENYFGGKEIIGLDHSKAEIFHKSIDRMVLRRTRSEVRPELPLGQRLEVKVQMTNEHKRQYEEFQTNGEVALRSASISGKGLLSELTRLRQMAYGVWDKAGANAKMRPTSDSPKLKFLMEWLSERGVGAKKETWLPEEGLGFKYVIASEWTEVLESIEEQLKSAGIPNYKIVGSTKQRDRDVAVRRFQSESDPVRVMLLNTFTGGESIELDAWCDEMLILDQTYVADDQVQLEGRINNRSGRVAPRSWTYLITEGTIEEKIAEMNVGQHDLQHKLLDKRRGVETALHLIGKEV